jgi:hypothetical protein
MPALPKAHRLFSFLALLSLLLCMTVGVLWVRAYDRIPPHISYFQKMNLVKIDDVHVAGVPYSFLAAAASVLPAVWLALLVVTSSHRRATEMLVSARERRGLCPTCGYNLTANISGICPECGAASR